MTQIQALFEQVTPQSLSSDIIISVILIIALWLYIFKKGVKNILIFAISLYIARGIVSIIPITIPNLEIISGAVVLFIIVTIAVYWSLSLSVINNTLAVSKNPLWKNLIFGVSVVGLLLVNILGGIDIADTNIASTIERSLFSTPTFQLFWTIFPLICIPFLKSGAKKSTLKSKK
jgi:hypothetical protein